ncbi:MAG: hypothetical protein HZB67_00425 [Candidatus Aenigmarchaeota archaeon]|nr:hypothetical protein [Candidatus Aenigmarchaeota archaeon]
MNKSKAIKQRSLFGCGIACVAYTLGVEYERALKLFKEGRRKAMTKGFVCREIVKALERGGKQYEYRYMNRRMKNKIYEKGTIVFIKRSKKYTFGHYLCRAEKSWMDPWINFQKNKDVIKAKAGFRKRLPGKASYVILPKKSA